MSATAIPTSSTEPASKRRTLLSADVTEEYLRSAAPGQGSITFEDGYKVKGHQAEINMADWLYCEFGGDIILLVESKTQGDRTPDYRWNGRSWELKGVTSKNSVDRAIREAAKQIQDNPGGIILDTSDSALSDEAIENTISQRMRRAALDLVDILIVSDKKLKKILRYKR